MGRSPRVVWVGLVSGAALGACGREAAPPAAPERAASPVVYGDDDRLQWYAVPDEATRELMRSAIAGMVPVEDVLPNGDGTYDLLSYETLGEANTLCADQLFYDEPTAAICSGTLIDSRLLLTAGHCVTSLADCAGYAWAFDYRYEAPGALAPVGEDSVYHCVDLVTNGFNDVGNGYDFAIIQLDRPVVGRTPAKVRRPGPVSRTETLTLIGFPNGIPMKRAANGAVIDPRAGDDTYFVGAVDAFYGNSGSGVFDEHLEVMGILVTGADDYVDAGSCSVVQVLDPSDGEEEMTYAYRAVKELCDKGYPSAALCGTSDAAACGDGFCTGDETAEGCAGDCDGLFAVPAGWTCNAGYYAGADGCDCDCGPRDPDCEDPQADVYNCMPGSACAAEGRCEEPIPESWICARDYFGVGDDCDCGCGAYDPDCDTNARIVGCARGSACLADGTCEVPVAPGWSCSQRWYASRDGCDCDCGAVDPDCADPSQAVTGCAPGGTCQADGTCDTPVPAGWLCSRQYFGAGDDCDCNCGARDPDCDAAGAKVLNCLDGQVCGTSGECRDPGVDPGPDAGPEVAPEVSPEAVVEPSPEAEVVEPSPEVGAEVVEAEDVAGTDGTSATEGGKTGGRVADDGCASGGGDAAGAWLAALAGLAGMWRRGAVGRGAARAEVRS